MNIAGRLFMDVSYTRTQHGNVGITRTVRRLLDELEASTSCRPVVFHRNGFRLLAQPEGSQIATEAPTVDNIPGGLFRWLNSAPVRRLVSLIPKAVLYKAWRLNNDLTLDSLSKWEEPVAFRSGDYLLLLDQSWNYRVWFAAEQARMLGVHVVLMVHDLIPIRHPEFCPPLFTEVFQKWLVRMLGCSDMVICNSAATKTDLLAWCAEKKLAPPHTAHFRLGCDLPIENGGEVRQSLAKFMQSSVPVFAAVGTIEPRKNYPMLLRAFENLWREGVAAHLLIAGRGSAEERAFVEKLRRHTEQGRKLLTLFDANDRELGHVYSKAQALVLASLAEGFGLPLVEARMRGCPVIASDLQALKELADEGVSFYHRNSLEELAALLVEQASFEKRSRSTLMPCFTWKNSAEQLIQVLMAIPEKSPLQIGTNLQPS